MNEIKTAPIKDHAQQLSASTEVNLQKILQGFIHSFDNQALASPEIIAELSRKFKLLPEEAAPETPSCLSNDIETLQKLLSSGDYNVNEVNEGETALSTAVAANVPEVVALLLKYKANPNLRAKKDESTPLMEAASAGYTEIVRLLLEHDACVMQTSNAENTALHYAAGAGHLDCVRLLLDYNSPLEHQNETGHTPLMEATNNAHLEVAKLLVQRGAQINNYSSEFKESALTLASYKGHTEMVRFLLANGADYEHRTDEMHNALMEASMDGHVEVAKLLLAHGASVNLPPESFESPLTLAACGGFTELAHLLIGYGANIEEVNDEGYTPLMEASREGHEETVALLLACGAEVNAKTEETQETALTLAACGGFIGICEMLIKAGAEIEVGGYQCSTPLMEAAQEGHAQLVTRLIDLGANVNAVTGTGDTALHYAAENGHVRVCRELILANAHLDRLAEGGKTPLMKAARAGHLNVVQFLLECGVNIDAVTNERDATALSLACAGGHASVVEFLLIKGADPHISLRDGCTMLIEAARSGKPDVMRLILDYPNSITHRNTDHLFDLPNMGDLTGLPDINQPTDDLLKSIPYTSGTKLLEDVCNHGVDDHLGSSIELEESVDALLTPFNRLDETAASCLMIDPSTKLAFAYGNVSTLMNHNMIEESDHYHNLNPDYQPLDFLTQNQLIFNELNAPETSAKLNLALSNAFANGWAQGVANLTRAYECQSFTNEVIETANRREEAKKSLLQSAHSTFKNLATDLLKNFELSEVKSILSAFNEFIPRTEADVEKMLKECTNLEVPNDSANKENGLSTFLSNYNSSNTVTNRRTQRSKLSTHHMNPRGSAPVLNGFFKRGKKSKCLNNHGSQWSHSTATLSTTASPISSRGGSGTFSCSSTSMDNLYFVVPNECQTYQENSPTKKPKNFGSSRVPLSSKRQTSIGKLINKDRLRQPTFRRALFRDLRRIKRMVHNGVICEPSPCIHCLLKIKSNSSKLKRFSFSSPTLSAHHIQPFFQLYAYSNQFTQPVRSVSASRKRLEPLQPTVLKRSRSFERIRKAPPLVSRSLSADALGVAVLALSPSTLLMRTPDGFFNEGQEVTDLCNECKMQHILTDFPHLFSNEPAHEISKVTNNFNMNFEHNINYPNMPHSELGSGCTCSICIKMKSLAQEEILLSRQQYTDILDPAFYDQLLPPHILNNQKQFAQDVESGYALLESLVQDSKCKDGDNSSVKEMDRMTPEQYHQIMLYFFHLGRIQGLHQLGAIDATKAEQMARCDPSSLSDSYFEDLLNKAALLRAHQSIQGQFIPDTMLPTPILSRPTAKTVQASVPSNNVESLTNFENMHSANQIDVNACTESMMESALSLAASHGFIELVKLLLERGANVEHRDKKSHTPLHTAVLANQKEIVALLIDHGADIEATPERSKDTALSMACHNGRLEIVKELITRGANKEHRNLSDYTPLSLAASSGKVDVIECLLQNGAEINSRSGSKLGISPLMLASMNGHVNAVKMLLDMGSDINAHIETNRNTALTLACFQGRHEVVQLLVERSANIEHRAKSGLTPLMEAASGDYVDVGKILIQAGADVNAAPVHSSRDTALTIAADKGNFRFTNMLLENGAFVEARNKKGATSLWLSANGGHLEVCKVLIEFSADVDTQDNRQVSALMSAFRKGHFNVVNLLVPLVTQFPLEKDLIRHIKTIVNDEELVKRCGLCRDLILAAKEKQEGEARKMAHFLLGEIEQEEEERANKAAQQAKKREKKRAKKKAQKQGKEVKDEEEIVPTPSSPELKQPNKKQSQKSTQQNAIDQVISELDKISVANTIKKSEIPPDSNNNALSKRSPTSYVQTVAAKYVEKESTESKRDKHRNKKNQQREAKRIAKKELSPERVPPENFQTFSPQASITANEEIFGEYAVADSEPEDWSAFIENKFLTTHSNDISSTDDSWRVAGSTKLVHANVEEPKSMGPLAIAKSDPNKKRVNLSISKHDIGKVIGQAGAVVSALRAMSGIQIDIESARGEDVSERQVSLKGATEVVNNVHEIIQALCSGALAGNEVLVKHSAHKKSGKVGPIHNLTLASIQAAVQITEPILKPATLPQPQTVIPSQMVPVKKSVITSKSSSAKQTSQNAVWTSKNSGSSSGQIRSGKVNFATVAAAGVTSAASTSPIKKIASTKPSKSQPVSTSPQNSGHIVDLLSIPVSVTASSKRGILMEELTAFAEAERTSQHFPPLTTISVSTSSSHMVSSSSSRSKTSPLMVTLPQDLSSMSTSEHFKTSATDASSSSIQMQTGPSLTPTSTTKTFDRAPGSERHRVTGSNTQSTISGIPVPLTANFLDSEDSLVLNVESEDHIKTETPTKRAGLIPESRCVKSVNEPLCLIETLPSNQELDINNQYDNITLTSSSSVSQGFMPSSNYAKWKQPNVCPIASDSHLYSANGGLVDTFKSMFNMRNQFQPQSESVYGSHFTPTSQPPPMVNGPPPPIPHSYDAPPHFQQTQMGPQANHFANPYMFQQQRDPSGLQSQRPIINGNTCPPSIMRFAPEMTDSYMASSQPYSNAMYPPRSAPNQTMYLDDSLNGHNSIMQAPIPIGAERSRRQGASGMMIDSPYATGQSPLKPPSNALWNGSGPSYSTSPGKPAVPPGVFGLSPSSKGLGPQMINGQHPTRFLAGQSTSGYQSNAGLFGSEYSNSQWTQISQSHGWNSGPYNGSQPPMMRQGHPNFPPGSGHFQNQQSLAPGLHPGAME